MSRLPLRRRLEIDEALLHEGFTDSGIESTYLRFGLGPRHGVHRDAFATYATSVRRVRMIGYCDRLAHGLLAGKPPKDRRMGMDLFTHRSASRIARRLAEGSDIATVELARLASSSASLYRAVRPRDDEARGRADSPERQDAPPTSEKVLAAIRRVYGLDPPPASGRSLETPRTVDEVE
jgi:hypothetical protein